MKQVCKIMSSVVFYHICLASLGVSIAFANAQHLQNLDKNHYPSLLVARGPYPQHHSPYVAPSRSVADTAEEYWISKKCIYPPKAFFYLYRSACEVRHQSDTFYSGICQSFFNSSKELCHLQGASEEELQTMSSIHDLQKNMQDDEICDTLAEMRKNDPTLFPTKKDKELWYATTFNILFSSDTCEKACGMNNAHALCFGFMLNYDFIEGLRHRVYDRSKDNEVEQKKEKEGDEANTEMDKQELNSKLLDDAVMVGAFEPEVNLTMPYRPNPKILKIKPSDPDEYYYEFDVEKGNSASNEILTEVLDDNPNLLGADALEDLISNEDYQIDPNVEVDDLPALSNALIGGMAGVEIAAKRLPSIPRHRLRGHVACALDHADDVPLFGLLIAFSSLLVVIALLIVYRARRSIGLYVGHIRQRRRNNWNYERVLVGPQDDELFE
ncbi:uncharacterized protein LOC143469728 isoform X2 [Clavelina lepadiformis]|uniref:uncharacterized protein LOC143469728 isoform X2 n=1 Tax=Clavelina lepadiformis TaxID=159417 RepID=UPI004043225B